MNRDEAVDGLRVRVACLDQKHPLHGAYGKLVGDSDEISFGWPMLFVLVDGAADPTCLHISELEKA